MNKRTMSDAKRVDDGGAAEAVVCRRCGDRFEFADQAECCEDFDCSLILSAAINNSRTRQSRRVE